MRTCEVITPLLVDGDAIREFVLHRGGEWFIDPEPEQGVFQDGESAVLVTVNSLEHISANERNEYSIRLSAYAQRMIILAMTKDDRAEEMARTIANDLATQFNGIIDWDDWE